MIRLHPHRVWIALLALALIIAAGNAPLIGIAQKKTSDRLAALRAEADKSANTLRQLREDIATTERLKNQIGETEAEKSLAPVDRLRAAQILERRAAESRLTHFTYTLSPERKTPVDTVGAGTQTLATSQLTLMADAPTDIDAYIFIDAVRRALPGRLTLRQFTLTRIGAADAPIAAANLRLNATAEWLSNGAAQNPAEETP
jgi:hypothetical protein